MKKRAGAIFASDLDERIIHGELGDLALALLGAMTVVDEVDSTNLALQRLPRASQHAHVIISGKQTAGRGRRGRTWHSPAGSNVYLSLGWRFGDSNGLTQLPLAVAVATVRALRRAGVQGCGIKWPNDILVDGKKLAGILVEVQRAGDLHSMAVVGIGINLGMAGDEETGKSITQPWTEMGAHMDEPGASDLRSRTCGLLIDELLPAMQHFAESGFHSFSDEWQQLDLLRGHVVRIDTGRETVEGIALGTGDRGGLRLRFTLPSGESAVQEFMAGEVSARLVGP